MTDTARLIVSVDATSATKATAQLDGLTAASARTQQATEALGETHEQQTKRIRDMVQATAGRVNAEKAAAQAASAGAQTAQRAGESLRSYTERTKGFTAATAARLEVSKAARLAQDAQMLSTKGMLRGEAALATSAGVTTVALDAQAGAVKLNSRVTAELGTLLGEAASGNFSRMKRSVSALANQSGLLAKAFTPVGLGILGVTAVIGTFAVAAFKGSEQSERLASDILQTGNAAGVTTGELEGMITAIGSANGSYGEARQAIELLAKSAKIPGLAMQDAAQSAIDFAKVTGSSMEEAVKAVTSLADDPVKAVKELNDSYHFLTPAIYAQITALQEQGKTDQAAAIAQKAFADANGERAKEVQKHLGWMQEAAGAVGHAFSAMWDSIEGVGRTKSLAQQAKSIQDQITNLSGLHSLSGGKVVLPGLAQDDPRLVKLRADLQAVRHKQAVAGLAAQDAEDKAAVARQFTVASDALLDGAKQYESAGKKAADEIKKVNANLAIAIAGDPTHANKYRAAAMAQIAGIRAQAAKKEPGSGHHVSFAELQDTATKGMNKTSATLAANLDASTASALKASNATAAYNATLQDMLATRQKEIDLQVRSVGMGDLEVQQQQRLISIDEDYNRKRAQLQRDQNDATRATDRAAYQQQLNDLDAYHTQRVAMELKGQADLRKAQESLTNGVTAALADIRDQGSNIAGGMANAVTGAFGNMTDAVVRFAQTGKFSLKDFAGNFAEMMLRMEVAALEAKAATAILGLFSTSSTSGDNVGYFGSFNQAAANQTAGNFIDSTYNANGGVYTSPSLSRYSGQVLDKPTLFAFANGGALGVAGEAGKEAIMPLATVGGKLGVRAETSGTGDVNITVVNNGQPVNASVQQSRAGNGALNIKVLLDAVDDRMAQNAANPSSKFSKAGRSTWGWQRRGVPVGA